jgi:PAS domain S-box-containing protein
MPLITLSNPDLIKRMEDNIMATTDKTEGRRLLIVDDEKDFALSLADILESYGYIVEKAHSGKGALEKIREFKANVALLDVRLGKDNGINLMCKLKEAAPKLLPIIMTAFATADTAIEALQEGAYDYLRKPLNPMDLLAKLDRCFERIRLEEEKEAAEETLKTRNRELEEINARLKKIAASAKTLTACTGSSRASQIMLETFAQNMAAQGGSLYLINGDRLSLIHAIDPGHAPDYIPLPPAEGSAIEEIFITKKPLLIRDIKKGADVISSGWEGYNDGSLIIFPLNDEKGDLSGVICLHNKLPPPFTPQDREIGSILASLCNETLRATHALETLRESEELYRLLVESMNDGLCMQDLNRCFTFVNNKMCEMTGLTREELIGKTITDLLDETNKTHFKAIVRDGMKQGLKPFELELSKKDGKSLPVIISPQTLRSNDGRLRGHFAVIVNISKRKEAEETRLRMETQLQQAQKMESIGTLAGGISHDFNNSLQAILGYTQMLLIDTEKMDTIHSRLLQIEKAANRAGDLTKQLLAFSRKVESQLIPADLNHEIRQIGSLLQRTILKMIGIELNLQEKLQVISADPSQIEQIIMNLAINARDAMGEEGKITIKTENIIIGQEYCNDHYGLVPGEYVLLTFSDTGHGMDKETIERIFEPFFTTKAPGKGTGLGLPMVYGLVKKHNGYIECESRLGEGTSFKIYFPVITDVLSESSGEEEKKPIPRGNENILLIDDEALVRDLGEHMLAKFGYNVLTAPGSESGLRIYREKKDDVSLVILDMIMPEMGGRRCFEEILKIKPGAKVIIASGYAADANIKSLLASGAMGFINKPFNVREMLIKVREALDA